MDSLVEDADDDFLSSILCSENYVLHVLLRERNEQRHRRHERVLTSNDDKRNFVDRQLHEYSY